MIKFKFGTYNYNQFELKNEGEITQEEMELYLISQGYVETGKGMYQTYCQVYKTTNMVIIEELSY